MNDRQSLITGVLKNLKRKRDDDIGEDDAALALGGEEREEGRSRKNIRLQRAALVTEKMKQIIRQQQLKSTEMPSDEILSHHMFGFPYQDVPARIKDGKQTVKMATFLLTINTNKQKENIRQIDLVKRIIEENVREWLSEGMYRDVFYHAVTPQGERIDPQMYPELHRTCMSCTEDKGEVQQSDAAWETGPQKKKEHIHMLVGFQYLSIVKGYYHINLRELQSRLHSLLMKEAGWPALDAIYMNSRYIKTPYALVANYIHKLKTDSITNTLVARTIQRIAEYKKTIQERIEEREEAAEEDELVYETKE